jgi:hypothetical protein
MGRLTEFVTFVTDFQIKALYECPKQLGVLLCTSSFLSQQQWHSCLLVGLPLQSWAVCFLHGFSLRGKQALGHTSDKRENTNVSLLRWLKRKLRAWLEPELTVLDRRGIISRLFPWLRARR